MKNLTTKEKENKAFEVMKEKFGYKNRMSSPHLVKVVVNVGTGNFWESFKNKNDFIVERLSKILGQKPSLRLSKQAVAGFKLRQNEAIGVSATLRGGRMYAFLDKFLNVSMPRTKDFRGLDRKIVDNIGNITMGIKEHTIFPETADEDIRDVFGMSITIVSSAKTKTEAITFFEIIGIPFKK